MQICPFTEYPKVRQIVEPAHSRSEPGVKKTGEDRDGETWISSLVIRKPSEDPEPPAKLQKDTPK